MLCDPFTVNPFRMNPSVIKMIKSQMDNAATKIPAIIKLIGAISEVTIPEGDNAGYNIDNHLRVLWEKIHTQAFFSYTETSEKIQR